MSGDGLKQGKGWEYDTTTASEKLAESHAVIASERRG
jgi:hypothetical protein